MFPLPPVARVVNVRSVVCVRCDTAMRQRQRRERTTDGGGMCSSMREPTMSESNPSEFASCCCRLVSLRIALISGSVPHPKRIEAREASAACERRTGHDRVHPCDIRVPRAHTLCCLPSRRTRRQTAGRERACEGTLETQNRTLSSWRSSRAQMTPGKPYPDRAVRDWLHCECHPGASARRLVD